MLFVPHSFKLNFMSVKHKKQFGVWMDSHQATIIGRESADAQDFTVLGYAKNDGAGSNSNENAGNNLERKMLSQFFKEILSYIQNVDEVHITGTGTAQQQFINFMAETPQYKNVKAIESTSNKMADEQLIRYIADQFN